MLARYSVVFRVCFGSDAIFKMMGKQFAFMIKDNSSRESTLENLQKNILFRLETSMLNYNFSGDDLISVQLILFEVNYTDKVVKPLNKSFTIKNLEHNKDLLDISNEKTNLAYNNIIPLSMDIYDYNNKLKINTDNDGLPK